ARPVAAGPHPAAAAGARPGRGDGRLAGKRPALVARARQPDPAVLLTLRPRLRRVPGDVDVPVAVGAERATTVQPGGRLDDVALRLEGRAVVIEARIEHRRRAARRPRLGLVRAHPGDVDPAVLTHRQVSAA